MVVSSDATPTMIGAVDWTNGLTTRASVQSVGPWVGLLGEEEGDMKIHIAEFLSLVVFACEVAPQWHKRMVGTLNGQVLVVSGAPSHYDSLNWQKTWGVLNCQCKETARSASPEVRSKVLMINPNHLQGKKWFNASLLLATHLFLKS